jgi:hypothetical protein
MMRIAAIAALSLAACGPLARGSGQADEDRLRLCVQNATVGFGNIVARAGLTRFNVMPGEEQCRAVTVTGMAIELRAATTGGGASGPLSYSERLQPGGSSCWRWRLTNARASSVDLTPCGDEPG